MENEGLEGAQCDTKKQEAMTFLRQRFLYLLSNLCVADSGECELVMYENTKVKCQIKAFDANFENAIVENLVTPVHSIQKAVLRTNDIISIEFCCNYNEIINKI